MTVPADYQGEPDMPERYTLLRSRSSVAVFFARGLVVESDVEAAVKTITESKMYPLSEIDNPPDLTAHFATGVEMDTISPMEPQAYWERGRGDELSAPGVGSGRLTDDLAAGAA